MLEEKEKALLNAEGEVAALNRRIQMLEEDLEKKDCSLPPKNWTKLPPLVMTPNVCARSWRTRACKTNKEWKPLRTNLRMPGYWLKRLTRNTMKSPRNWPPLSQILRGLRREPTPVSTRSLSSKKN